VVKKVEPAITDKKPEMPPFEEGKTYSYFVFRVEEN